MVVTMYTDFYNDCKNSRAIIGYFLLSISGQTQIYSLCDNDAILLASDGSFSHFCLVFFLCFDLILPPLPFCYFKKQIDVSFSCVCPVIDNKVPHNIVKVVCGSTRLSPHGSTTTLGNVCDKLQYA